MFVSILAAVALLSVPLLLLVAANSLIAWLCFVWRVTAVAVAGPAASTTATAGVPAAAPRKSGKRWVVVQHSAFVVVGGDFSRSPRMQYHAVSLCDATRPTNSKSTASPPLFGRVFLVGYDEGNRLCEDLQRRCGLPERAADGSARWAVADQSRLFSPPTPPPAILRLARRVGGARAAWVVGAVLRVLLLLRTLCAAGRDMVAPALVDGAVVVPALVLLQTPPAVPFIPVIRLAIWALAPLTLRPDVPAWDAILREASSTPSSRWRLAWRLAKAPARRGGPGDRPAVVVDWHNFGFSIMCLDKRPRWMIRLYEAAERRWCGGDYNLTVSRAMRDALVLPPADRVEGVNPLVGPFCGFGLSPAKVAVLHDCSPSFFRPLARTDLVDRVLGAFDDRTAAALAMPPQWVRDTALNPSAGTVRGRVVVSSTSWTADDDYSMVLDALEAVRGALERHNAAAAQAGVPPSLLWFVVTGKGCSRAVFEAQVRERGLSEPHSPIVVSTVYLQSFAQYAAMLGGADVGLSLHASSSGLDLPMKCVDMFGCGLPVLALRYHAIGELVEAQSGFVFDDAAALAQVLQGPVLGLPTDDCKDTDRNNKNSDGGSFVNRAEGAWQRSEAQLGAMRAQIATHQGRKWADTWNAVALPLVDQLVGGVVQR